MLLLATFFPTSGDYSDEDPTNFSALQELLKCTVDLIDLIGLSVVMSRIAGKGHTKVLCRTRLGRCRIGTQPSSCLLGWCPWN